MFVLHADKTNLTLRDREQLTSGSVNVYTVRFEFSPDWEGLTRTAVFRAGAVSRSVLLDDTGECAIPWEVLEKPARLKAGVYGKSGEDVVLPTIWANLGVIQEGAAPGEDARPPTPELWRQELNRKQDKLTGQPGQMVGFDEDGNAVPQDAAPGGGGGADYRIGHGLAVEHGELTVVTTDDFKGDNTLPMTAAGVETVVGNIEALLGTI